MDNNKYRSYAQQMDKALKAFEYTTDSLAKSVTDSLTSSGIALSSDKLLIVRDDNNDVAEQSIEGTISTLDDVNRIRGESDNNYENTPASVKNNNNNKKNKNKHDDAYLSSSSPDSTASEIMSPIKDVYNCESSWHPELSWSYQPIERISLYFDPYYNSCTNTNSQFID